MIKVYMYELILIQIKKENKYRKKNNNEIGVFKIASDYRHTHSFTLNFIWFGVNI